RGLRLRILDLLRQRLDVVDRREHLFHAPAGVEVVHLEIRVPREEPAQDQVVAEREPQRDHERPQIGLRRRGRDEERDQQRHHPGVGREVVEDPPHHLYAVALRSACTRSLEAMNEPPVSVAISFSVPVSALSPYAIAITGTFAAFRLSGTWPRPALFWPSVISTISFLRASPGGVSISFVASWRQL